MHARGTVELGLPAGFLLATTWLRPTIDLGPADLLGRWDGRRTIFPTRSSAASFTRSAWDSLLACAC